MTKKATNHDRWCFAWQQPQLVAGKAKAVLLKDARWNPGDVITVSFMDGSEAIQKKSGRLHKNGLARIWRT